MIKIIVYLTKLVAIAFVAMLFASCKYSIDLGRGEKGSGNITTQTRAINSDFSKIEVSNGIEVIVEQSDDKSVTVATDDNLQKLIVTKVENGVLIVEADKSFNATETPRVTVKMPVIKGLSADSGAEIKSQNTLITPLLAVESDSGSTINITVEADAITLESASGSTIEASGKALKLETTSKSGSSIDAEKLMANEVIAQSNSGSSTDVYPILKLDAKASSGSSINYHKAPKNLSKEESSGGSVDEE